MDDLMAYMVSNRNKPVVKNLDLPVKITHNGAIVDSCSTMDEAVRRLSTIQPKSIWEATRKDGWKIIEGVNPTDSDNEDTKIKKLTEEDEQHDEPVEEPDPVDVQPENDEHTDQEGILKEYIGKTDDTHYYLTADGGTEEEPSGLKVVDQEGNEQFADESITDPVEFITRAIQDLEISEITRSIFTKYILPKLEEPIEEPIDDENAGAPPEAIPEDGGNEDKEMTIESKNSKINEMTWSQFKKQLINEIKSGKGIDEITSLISQFESEGMVFEHKTNEAYEGHDPASKDDANKYWRDQLVLHLKSRNDLTPEEKELLAKAEGEMKESTNPVDSDAEDTKIKKLIETVVNDGSHDFDVELVDDDNEIAIAIEGEKFRFDNEFANLWRDADGKISEDGVKELALDVLSTMDPAEYEELVKMAHGESHEQAESDVGPHEEQPKDVDFTHDDVDEKRKLPDALKKHMFKKKDCKKTNERKWKETIDLSFLSPYVNGDVEDYNIEDVTRKVMQTLEDFKSVISTEEYDEFENVYNEFEMVGEDTEQFDNAMDALYDFADQSGYWVKVNESRIHEKTDPNAKVRNRGDAVFKAGSSKVKDNKDHFPINNANQARNALSRVAQYDSVPDWYKGSLKSLQNAVRRAVKAKYKDIEVSESKINEKTNVWDVYLNGKKIDTVTDVSDDAKDVKDSLINHDGYDSGIVVKMRHQKTHPYESRMNESIRGTSLLKNLLDM